MNRSLKELENKSIFILREAYANFDSLAMLWSMGKDSSVLLRLTQKAFFGHIPYPCIHIDTSFKIKEMIEFRNQVAMELKITLIVGQNENALLEKQTYPDGTCSRLECCQKLKTDALKKTLDGTGVRKILNLSTGEFEKDASTQPFEGVIVGLRADEEGSRSKERYFSPREENSHWDLENQPPELWNQFNTEFQKGTHVRIHPLLDWREVDIWHYIEQEKIKVVPLYFQKNTGKRYRSLGCAPCTQPIESQSQSPQEIIQELTSGALSQIAERSGRAQDKEDGGGLENLRRGGYM